MDRRYELNTRGYTIEGLEQRVLDLFRIDKEDLYSKSRQKPRAEARSVFCYWGVREVGLEGTRIAKRLNMSQPGVAYAVQRGEKIVKDNDFQISGNQTCSM